MGISRQVTLISDHEKARSERSRIGAAELVQRTLDEGQSASGCEFPVNESRDVGFVRGKRSGLPRRGCGTRIDHHHSRFIVQTPDSSAHSPPNSTYLQFLAGRPLAPEDRLYQHRKQMTNHRKTALVTLPAREPDLRNGSGTPPSNDLETGDPLPQLQRVGTLETPVLQAFRDYFTREVFSEG